MSLIYKIPDFYLTHLNLPQDQVSNELSNDLLAGVQWLFGQRVIESINGKCFDITPQVKGYYPWIERALKIGLFVLFKEITIPLLVLTMAAGTVTRLYSLRSYPDVWRGILGEKPFFFEILPNEDICKIFTYTESLATFSALSSTCQSFHQVVHQYPGILVSAIQGEISRTIEACPSGHNNPLHKGIAEQILKIISHLPTSVVFPPPEGPFIPVIRHLFEELAKKTERRRFGSGVRKALRDFFDAQPDKVIAKRFLYNLPTRFLHLFDQANIEEFSRRFELEKPTEEDKDYFSSAVTHFGLLAYGPPDGLIEFLAHSSDKFFGYIIMNFGHMQVWLIPQWITMTISIEDKNHACRKLCIIIDYFISIKNKEILSEDLNLLADPFDDAIFYSMYLLNWKKPSQATADQCKLKKTVLKLILMTSPEERPKDNPEMIQRCSFWKGEKYTAEDFRKFIDSLIACKDVLQDVEEVKAGREKDPLQV